MGFTQSQHNQLLNHNVPHSQDFLNYLLTAHDSCKKDLGQFFVDCFALPSDPWYSIQLKPASTKPMAFS